MIRDGITPYGSVELPHLAKLKHASQVFDESKERTKVNPIEYPFTIEEVREKFIKYLESEMSK